MARVDSTRESLVPNPAMKGLAGSLTAEAKERIGTAGVEHGVTAEAVEMAMRVGNLVADGVPDAVRRTAEVELKDLVSVRLSVTGRGDVVGLRAWCEANMGRDNLSSEELEAIQLYFDIADAVALGTIANCGRLRGEVVVAVDNQSGQEVENTMGIAGGELKGIGDGVVDAAILESDFSRILRDVAAGVGAGDVRGSVMNAIRSMERIEDRGGEGSTREAEFGMIVHYLHEMNEAMNSRRGRPMVPVKGESEGDAERWEEMGGSMDMQLWRYRELERQQEDPHIYKGRMPEWYNALTPQERAVFDVRFKLCEVAAAKREVRNKLPVEKLRTGVVPELDNREFALLWDGMPGFKEAMGFLVRDICQLDRDVDGRVFLRLKHNQDGKLDPEVVGWLAEFDTLRDRIAGQVAEARRGVGAEVQVTDTEAVSTMWNFMFVGDVIEAWDFYRELKPTWVVSDKLRTYYHLRAKALGKWRVFKPTGVSVESAGEEEPFVSPNMSVWVLDRLGFESGFSDRLLTGDLKDILPDTLAVSMVETQVVSVELPAGKIKIPMALALMAGLEESVELPRDDRNVMQVHNDQVEGMDFLASCFKGGQPLDMAKGGDEWVSKFIQSTSLVRQVPTIPVMAGGESQLIDPEAVVEAIASGDAALGRIACVDKPMFFWSIILSSTGFNPYDKFPLIPEKKLGATGNNFDLKVRDLVDDMAIRSTVDKMAVRRLLGADGFVQYKKHKVGNDRERFGRMKKF